MKKRYLKSSCLFVLVLMLLAVIFPAGAFAQPEVKTTAATADESVIGVSYRGHVQNYGNMPKPEGTMIAGPEALGTTGEGLRLEGFWIDLTGDVPANGGINYAVHVQNIGWQDAVDSGDFAGTNARGLRIEAIKISLENLPDYDVYYRGHVQNVGNIPQIEGDWGWVKNGEELGTTGKGQRLEELQVKIVRKGIDLTAYNTLLDTIEKLDAANYSPESWATLQTALTQNKMTEANSQTSIDAATQAIQAAYDALSLKVVAVYDKPGVYGPETGSQTIEGSVIIDVSGVTLQNLVIKGDLTVSEAVGDGDATLNYLTVEGTTILAGGGTGGATLAGQSTSGDMTLAANSGGITINGGKYKSLMIDKKDNGGIRISMINTVTGRPEVIDIPEGQPIFLEGHFNGLGIYAPDVKLVLAPGTSIDVMGVGNQDSRDDGSGLVVTGSGTINYLMIDESSSNVNLGANIKLDNATIRGDNATIDGNVGYVLIQAKNAFFGGTVGSAEIYDDSARFVVAPEHNFGTNYPIIITPPAPGGGGSTTTPLAKVNNVVFSQFGLATWDNVANESSFDVQLYKNGVAYGAVVNVPANTLEKNFALELFSASAGAYTVKVTAKGNGVTYSDGAVSDASSARNITQLATVNGLTWSGDVAHWSPVAGAEFYDVKLYKDYNYRLEHSFVIWPTEEKFDVPAANVADGINFASVMSDRGLGTYTYTVTAKVYETTGGSHLWIRNSEVSVQSENNVKAEVSTVSNLSATAGNQQVVLSWTAPTGATAVQLQVKETSQDDSTYTKATYAITDTDMKTATTATATGLTNGKSYTFRLNVTGGANQGYSNTVAAIPALAVSNLSATAGNEQVVLSWTAPTGATAVELLVKETSEGDATYAKATYSITDTAMKTATTATATGLTNGTSYTFRLNVTGGANQGRSNTASATPAAPAVAAPALVNGVSFADDNTNDNQTVIALGAPSVNGNTFVYKISDDANTVATPNVGEDLSTWTAVANGDSITAANGKHIGVAEVNAAKKAVQFSDATAVTEPEVGPGPASGLTVTAGTYDTTFGRVPISVSETVTTNCGFLYRVVDVAPTAPNVGDSLIYPNNWNNFTSPTEATAAHGYFVEVIEVDYSNGNSIIHWGYVMIPV